MNWKLISLVLIYFNLLQGCEVYISKNSEKLLKITLPNKKLIGNYKYWGKKIIEILKYQYSTKDNLLIKAIIDNDIEQIKKNISYYDLNKPFICMIPIDDFNMQMYFGKTYLSLEILLASYCNSNKLLKSHIEIIKLLIFAGCNINYKIGQQYYCGEEFDCEFYFTIMKFAFEIDSHYTIMDLLVENGGIIPENTPH